MAVIAATTVVRPPKGKRGSGDAFDKNLVLFLCGVALAVVLAVVIFKVFMPRWRRRLRRLLRIHRHHHGHHRSGSGRHLPADRAAEANSPPG